MANKTSKDSTYKTDAEFERVSLEYLVYKQPDLLKEAGITVKEVVTDRDRQKEGIDVVADVNYKGVLYKDAFIDFKAVAAFIPTFSQEVMNTTSTNYGWLMNPTLKTDFYLYIWHDLGPNKRDSYRKNKEIIVRNPDLITDNRLVLLKKDELRQLIRFHTGVECTILNAYSLEWKIQDYLGSFDELTNLKETIRLSVKNGAVGPYRKDDKDKVYLTITGGEHLKEKPINFIVKATELARWGKLVGPLSYFNPLSCLSTSAINEMMGHLAPADDSFLKGKLDVLY